MLIKSSLIFIKARGGGRPVFDPYFGPFLGLPSYYSVWHPGPDGYVRIDFARTVWKKNGVNFSSKINVNPVISGLVGYGASNRVSIASSDQEGSLCKVSCHNSKWSSSYLGLTKSGKIAFMAPLNTPFFHTDDQFLRKRLGPRPCRLAYLFYRRRSMKLM